MLKHAFVFHFITRQISSFRHITTHQTTRKAKEKKLIKELPITYFLLVLFGPLYNSKQNMKILIFFSIIFINLQIHFCITFYPKLDLNHLEPKYPIITTPTPLKNRFYPRGTFPPNRRASSNEITKSPITYKSDTYLDEDEDDAGIGIVDTSQPVDDILSLSNVEVGSDESVPVQCNFVTFGSKVEENGAYAWHAAYPLLRTDGENDRKGTYVRAYQSVSRG